MDIEKFSEKMLASDRAEALKRLSQSETGRSVAAMLDEDRLNRALQTGDTAALQKTLGQLLATPQGKALVSQVKKVVEKHE